MHPTRLGVHVVLATRVVPAPRGHHVPNSVCTRVVCIRVVCTYMMMYVCTASNMHYLCIVELRTHTRLVRPLQIISIASTSQQQQLSYYSSNITRVRARMHNIILLCMIQYSSQYYYSLASSSSTTTRDLCSCKFTTSSQQLQNAIPPQNSLILIGPSSTGLRPSSAILLATSSTQIKYFSQSGHVDALSPGAPSSHACLVARRQDICRSLRGWGCLASTDYPGSNAGRHRGP